LLLIHSAAVIIKAFITTTARAWWEENRSETVERYDDEAGTKSNHLRRSPLSLEEGMFVDLRSPLFIGLNLESNLK
jgi:hypothetical protein